MTLPTDINERASEAADRIEQSLTNVTPTDLQVKSIQYIRVHAKALARVIINCAPAGRERAIALTDLETATMWAVKAVVLP